MRACGVQASHGHKSIAFYYRTKITKKAGILFQEDISSSLIIDIKLYQIEISYSKTLGQNRKHPKINDKAQGTENLKQIRLPPSSFNSAKSFKKERKAGDIPKQSSRIGLPRCQLFIEELGYEIQQY